MIYKSKDNNNQITYQITDKGIKEEIILVSKENIQYVFTYELQLGNMALLRELDNTYNFIDKTTKKPIFTIPKPFMTDAKGVKSENIQIYHRVRDNKDYLELVADKQWLTDPRRVYPIIIDPTIETPQGETSAEVIQKRNQTTKTFSLGNGKYAAVSGENHYQDNTGQWQEIDTTIVPSDDSNYEYMNKTNNFHTYFTKNSDGTNKNVKFQIGDASVSFNSLNNININGRNNC